MLEHHWHARDGTIRSNEFANHEAIATTITAFNFRLSGRLMSQAWRIKKSKSTHPVVGKVVDAACDYRVIGSA